MSEKSDREFFAEEFRRLHSRINDVKSQMSDDKLEINEKLHNHHVVQLKEMNKLKINLAKLTTPIAVVFGFVGAFIKAHLFHK